MFTILLVESRNIPVTEKHKSEQFSRQNFLIFVPRDYGNIRFPMIYPLPQKSQI